MRVAVPRQMQVDERRVALVPDVAAGATAPARVLVIMRSLLDAAGVLVPLGIALLLGILLVLPVGSADLPVVISPLNSFYGLAGRALGVIFAHQALIIEGALVRASGLIHTHIMCKAMNRSLASMLFSGFGGGDGAAGIAVSASSEQRIRAADAEEGAVILGYGYALSVIIVRAIAWR